MNGLSSINIELTSRCNKNCWMCGRRKVERDHPHLADWGDMSIDMVHHIAQQTPEGVMVQFHNNGDPLMYPKLGIVIAMFKIRRCYTSFDTNAKLLFDRKHDIVEHQNLDSIAISVIQDDPEGEEQLEIVGEFLEFKGDRKPLVVFRLLGKVDDTPWRALADKHGCVIARRILHNPDGSRDYERPVTIPETGICQELLHKLSIDRYGNVSPCVRFDPHKLGVIGNVSDWTLSNIWNGVTRRYWLDKHFAGDRNDVALCAKCDYWGCPTA